MCFPHPDLLELRCSSRPLGKCLCIDRKNPALAQRGSCLESRREIKRGTSVVMIMLSAKLAPLQIPRRSLGVAWDSRGFQTISFKLTPIRACGISPTFYRLQAGSYNRRILPTFPAAPLRSPPTPPRANPRNGVFRCGCTNNPRSTNRLRLDANRRAPNPRPYSPPFG